MEKKFKELIDVLDKVHGEKGCPWAKNQTLETHINEVESEVKEVRQAIESKDYENLKEELGDLLFDALTLCKIAESKGLFETKEVIEKVTEKMIRRKPHVFGNEKAETVEDTLKIWYRVKAEEKEKAKK